MTAQAAADVGLKPHSAAGLCDVGSSNLPLGRREAFGPWLLLALQYLVAQT